MYAFVVRTWRVSLEEKKTLIFFEKEGRDEMKRIILCIALLCYGVVHGSVVDLGFESYDGQAYAYAYAEGSTSEEQTIEYNEYSPNAMADAMAISTYIFPPVEHVAEASATSNGTNSSLSCLASDPYCFTTASTDFSGGLLIGTAADIPVGTPLTLLVNIVTLGDVGGSTLLDLSIFNPSGASHIPGEMWLTELLNETISMEVNAGDMLNFDMYHRLDWAGPGRYESDMQVTFEVVPEPCTLLLLGLGVVIIRKH